MITTMSNTFFLEFNLESFTCSMILHVDVPLESVDENLSVTIQIKVAERYFPVVLLVSFTSCF